MDFFRVIPEEVIVHNLLPQFRDVNDLLRIRRVCRLGRTLADDYMRLQGIRSRREVTVKLRHIVAMGRGDFECFNNTKDLNWSGRADTKVGGTISGLISLKEAEVEGTLANLLKNGHLVPIDRIYLNTCCMRDLWKNPQMSKFMNTYSNQITQLRLNKLLLTTPLRDGRPFFGGFINLECLEIKELSGTDPTPCSDVVPVNFRKLKSLKIHSFTAPHHPSRVVISVYISYYQSLCAFIKACCFNDKIEHLDYPAYLTIPNENNEPGTRQSFMIEEYLKTTSEILNWRSAQTCPDTRGVVYVDLRNFWFPGPSRANVLKFLEFGRVCMANEVKLLNLDQTLLRSLVRAANEIRVFATFSGILNHCVISLRNLHALECTATLPHLQRILISRTSLCSIRNVRLTDEQRPEWSKLSTIHLTVDSEELALSGFPNENLRPTTTTFALFDFFFGGGVRRESMTELKMKFTKSITSGIIPLPLCPNARDITASCSNLRILALDSWPGGNNELSRLWDGLPLLEEVSLINCKLLDMTAFTGGRSHNPSFLQLQRLKKLSLNHIDNMPEIDDNLFIHILRHIGLRELHLTSDNPIRNITVTGIASLLVGRLAGSIERFPLANYLKLDGVSVGELKALEGKFRSSKMI